VIEHADAHTASLQKCREALNVDGDTAEGWRIGPDQEDLE
jgi:hypothetical protein